MLDNQQLTLGIESSCDETAAAIVRADGLVLSDIKATQIDIFKNLGGVVPEMAARAHTEKILPVIDEALKAAAVDWAQIDQIHVTEGPGLIGSLLVGHSAAQALAMAYNKPLHWVNHLRAHCLACWLWEAGETKPEIVFPSIGLLVSGGHTQLLWMKDYEHWEIVGETIDDAAGEAFDKVGKMLGLPYPGGPEVSKAAEKGNPQAFKFPRAQLEKGSLDFSFSGLKTAVLREIKKVEIEQLGDLEKKQFVSDVAASFEEAVIEVLLSKTRWAVLKYQPLSILLAGGVAANKALRGRMKDEFSSKFYLPQLKFCTDNAAMVGVH